MYLECHNWMHLYVWGWGGVVKICATSLVELSSIFTAYGHVFVQ